MTPNKLRLSFALALTSLALAPPAGGQTPPVSPATLIQTIHTSLWSPPSPDPSCVTFRAETGDFWTTDNEVDETIHFAGVSLWRHDSAGNVSNTYNLTGFTLEPSGIAFDPAGGRAWISDDNQKTVWKVNFGQDNEFLTSDDSIEDMDGLIPAGCDDPEDVTYNPFTGNLHVVSVDSDELCKIAPGPNGVFDDAAPIGDDVVTVVSLAPNILKPKGVTYDPIQNTLIVADRGTGNANRDLYEVSLDGVVLRKIDGTVVGGYKPSGVTFAPSTVNPMLRALYVSDNAVDNGVVGQEDENDGKIHEFVVAPLNGNGAPVVDAGPAQAIEWPANGVTLDGFVSDDGHPYPPSALVSTWIAQSGPGTVTFGDPNEVETTATFSAPGVYVLRLEGDDFALTSSDTVDVTVAPASYDLAVSTTGSGSVTRNPATGPYAEGTIVTLTATPAANAMFHHWSGDLSGSVNPQTIAMTADRSVSAEFRSTSVPGCGIGPELALFLPGLWALRGRRRSSH